MAEATGGGIEKLRVAIAAKDGPLTLRLDENLESSRIDPSAGGEGIIVEGRSLESLAKTSQLKAVARWLSRDTLPAYVSSYVKAAVWCRRDQHRRPAFLLLNASADPLAEIALCVRDADRLEASIQKLHQSLADFQAHLSQASSFEQQAIIVIGGVIANLP